MGKIPSIYSLETYDYELPPDRIAKFPVEPRDSSRLLVVYPDGQLEETIFRELPRFLYDGDLLVLNETKVFPARIFGRKNTGGRVEVLLLENLNGNLWKALVRPARRLPIGTEVYFECGLVGRILGFDEDGSRVIEFNFSGESFFKLLETIGHMPLPSYIGRVDTESDRISYQTVYARKMGAVAAPTAGLHFTKQLLKEIEGKGIEFAKVTLHIGWGTFRPIRCEDIRCHKMHREYYEISKRACDKINKAKQQRRRVVAVGTTTTRALETAAMNVSTLRPQKQWTDLYIYPGFEFKVVDCLITNFHLPQSSLLVMVSAFAGVDKIKRAYQYAIEHNFRFYSYGDAMFIIGIGKE